MRGGSGLALAPPAAPRLLRRGASPLTPSSCSYLPSLGVVIRAVYSRHDAARRRSFPRSDLRGRYGSRVEAQSIVRPAPPPHRGGASLWTHSPLLPNGRRALPQEVSTLVARRCEHVPACADLAC